jgi:hypothetical protein
MLNAKYFYAGSEVQGVFQNPYALGNAWFVDNIIEVNSPDEEIVMIGSIKPDSSCVIDVSKFDHSQQSVSGDGIISLVEYRPDYLKYETSNDGEGLAIFSEVYYPEGWSATVDGTKTDIKRVNYILRALEVPAGNHTIEFKFEPRSYYLGNKISLVGSIMTLLVFFGSIWMDHRSRSKNNKGHDQ